MATTNKTHARDYLLDYKAKSTTPLWLASLIQVCIDINGVPSATVQSEIFTQLLQENDLEQTAHVNNSNENTELDTESQIPSTHVNQHLVIKKITHLKGVNALIHDQSIVFSPTCTIIFGLNGTGKSGYFRIIHEVAGGIKSKKILDNIHGHDDGLAVNVEYSLDSIDQKYEWQDKHSRGILPFNIIKVFDSEYMPAFLNERESSVNIEPLGLNLFQIIASVIDKFKDRLEELQNKQTNLTPDLQSLIDALHSEELKSILEEDELSEDESKLLASYISITDEEAENLAQLNKQKQDLEKQNSEDSLKVINQEKNELTLLNDHLTSIKSSLQTLTRQASEAITDFNKKKKVRDEKAKEFEVLRNIPSRESDEWQSFIESAHEYGIKIEKNILNTNDTCLYCHQQLNEGALKLVTAYFEYINDQSQENLRTAVTKISLLLKAIENFNVGYSLSENLETILVEAKRDQVPDVKMTVDQIIDAGNNQKRLLRNSLEKKSGIEEDFTLELNNVNTFLIGLISQRQNQTDRLGQSMIKRQDIISNLNAQINKLEDKQNVSKWKTRIEARLSSIEKTKKYQQVNSAIVTTGITVLGSKAHDELLTESIRKSFDNELKAIGKDVDVSLEKTGAGKGIVRTSLKVLGNDVQDILSTGEQKAVCLALFIGEVLSQGGNSPIVFDDPVTSVDHEVAGLLAKRLLQIAAKRQIIIFTHDKLFYDSLVSWCGDLKNMQGARTHHVCKNYIVGGCNTEGHHVFTYTVDRESKDRTGRVFERQNESCAYFISKAEQEMNGSYSIHSLANFLKLAIEYYIDDVILNKQGLLRNRVKGNNINWDQIKKINIDKDKIDKLNSYWNLLSDRGSHSTQNSTQNPLKADEIKEIIEFLKA